ncbi:glycosylhydrolase family 18-9 [Pyrenophora seminiperda CCB06]|uniref:Glycosylhydrolase family 18-9 n=1 Tax=Pyrenophora seminiperda CCB06 TaxID=1302712 RepID=A0A3M7M2Y4_9PLEO|nr:glycosylhydrolase family 18-9 [Pyrenophora seminiperda CCB06]
MQGVASERESDEDTGKRKYSIRQERERSEDDEDDTRASKVQKLSHGDDSNVEDEEATIGLLSPSPTVSVSTIAKEDDDTSTALAPITPRTKRILHLPPIRTSHITTPSTHMTPSFTALFNTLKQEVGHTYTPPQVVYTPHPSHALNPNLTYPRKSQPQAIPQHYLPNEARRREMKRNQCLQAAQRATHNFNILRMETERLGRAYEEAKWRCEDARRRMEDMWWRTGWRG